ncbi:alpha/beta fold hydrolase [Schaalia vaccimaxillae]|uniref:alpha/beta fold hydrolase n=1 Tax=Schaalia vaccimaxillae TaxID=183916 RepID=UPI0003B57F80|nr:alpha/beta fold hydrolase [Schaalia vaccimaxillae]
MTRHDIAFSVSGNEGLGTIVALHGVTDNGASLSDIARYWNPRWQVYLADTLGHGLSRHLTEEELIDPFDSCVRASVKLVVEAARTATKGRVVLIGHSLGGAIATRIACEYPDLISSLILEDPALLTEEQVELYRTEAQSLVDKQELVTSHVGEAMVELMRIYPAWPASEYGAWAQGKTQVDRAFVATGIVGQPGREILASLRVPTLLVTGDGQDVLFGAEGLREVKNLNNPNIEVAMIAGASHVVRRDRPEEFYSLADAFLHRRIADEAEAPHPWIAPELLPVIDATPPQDTHDVQALRAKGEELLAGVAAPADVFVEEVRVGSDKQPIDLRVLRRNMDRKEKALVLSIHGGGYVAGRARYDDERNAELIDIFSEAVVGSPEYRLAPEFPFPAGAEDCYASLLYLADRFNGLPVYIYGDSAGAGLARQVAELNIERGSKVPISALILLEPCLEPQMSTQSFDVHADGPIWTRSASEGAWGHYLNRATTRLPYVPSRNVAMKMPPSLIIVNPVDPLRDEGIRLATELVDAGVTTEMHMLAGTIHGALSVPGTTTWSRVKQIIQDFIEVSETSLTPSI